MNLDILTRPFAPSEVKQRTTQDGRTFDYVEAHSVITRLNEAFQGAWSFRVVQYQMIDNEVIVLGELSADGCVKQQFGGAVSDREHGGGLSLGDAMKAAASDCLKKCATEFGVALELYIGMAGSEPALVEVPAEGKVVSHELATDKQRAVLEKIARRSDVSDEDRARLRALMAGPLTKPEASDLITSFTRKRAA
ncbi:MAG: hypothetical protein HY710_13350 [Candidatus Latescibacteria bacterium]|nr:hypothetical protein [Candidatus Latescibacterota bacterium]